MSAEYSSTSSTVSTSFIPLTNETREIRERTVALAKLRLATLDDGDWTQDLQRGERGGLRGNLNNIVISLRNEHTLKGLVQFNEFTNVVEVTRRPPVAPDSLPGVVRPMTDPDIAYVQIYLSRMSIRANATDTLRGLDTVAREHGYHPVKDYLTQLEWDGVPRLDRWMTEYLVAEDTTLNHAIASKWCIGAVKRIMNPGCKMDYAPILEGKQGIGKSGVLRALMPNNKWFSDQLPDLGNKDANQHLSGLWVVEIAEFDTYSRAEASRIKAFQTRTSERFRPPYGKLIVDIPRTCVFAISINPDGTGYLKDQTGGRRFWIVECGIGKPDGWSTDFKRVEDERDQIWAEAMVRYRQCETTYLDTHLEAMARENAAERTEQDVLHDMVAEYCDKRREIFVRDLISAIFKGSDKRFDNVSDKRVTRILQKLGYRQNRTRQVGDRRVKVWTLVTLSREPGDDDDAF